MTSGRVVKFDPSLLLAIDKAIYDADNRRIRLLPAAEYYKFNRDALQVWMMFRAVYTIPTVELVEWLTNMIGGRTAIEVGAGNGDLYYHLGITGTDSYLQQTLIQQMYYASIGQTPTKPKEDVIQGPAEDLVKAYRPQVVIASYLTRKFIEGQDEDGKAQASIYGVVEEEIIDNCETYIHIGNETVHDQKTVLKREHQTYKFPWLITRGDWSKAVIYVWDNKQ